MPRQPIKNDVPELWKKRAYAGLCPVCGKTKIEFDKGMIVYCSVRCREKYAEKYDLWQNVRDKILKRDNYTCKECGINEEKARIKLESSKELILKEFLARPRRRRYRIRW